MLGLTLQRSQLLGLFLRRRLLPRAPSPGAELTGSGSCSDAERIPSGCRYPAAEVPPGPRCGTMLVPALPTQHSPARGPQLIHPGGHRCSLRPSRGLERGQALRRCGQGALLPASPRALNATLPILCCSAEAFGAGTSSSLCP